MFTMDVRIYFLLAFLLVSALGEQATPNYGRYQNSVHCSREPLSVSAKRSPGDAGFKIKVSGNPERYTPGEIYTGEYYLKDIYKN